MYCDCCDKRIDIYPKDPEHPLCRSCSEGECWDCGHQ